MSIKNRKYGFNFNEFKQNSTVWLSLLSFMTKMNITTVIEVLAGKF